jgi:hypothetical protein
MDVSEAKRLKQLGEKNANLKKARPPSDLAATARQLQEAGPVCYLLSVFRR